MERLQILHMELNGVMCSKNMDVSVIIVNYNTKDITKNCIDSVFNCTSGLTFEVILVDNASIDGSRELFNKDNRIVYIYSEENLGFGKANNLGYKYAKGKYLFLLNSDTLLLNNAIYYFYSQMEHRDDSVACMGCALLNSHYKPGHSYGNYPTIQNELARRPLLRFISFLNGGFDSKPIQIVDDNCMEVEYICGADLFLKKSVADNFGLFDPHFFMYYEDVEMQFRYRKNGFSNVIVKGPSIIHLEGGSQGKRSNLTWRSNDIGSVLYCCRKIHGRLYTVLFKIVMLLVYLPLFIIDYRCGTRIKYNVLRDFVLL